MSMGMMAPVMTLVLHIIFGAVLGFVFAKLGKGA
jgi:cbb3-type cytochrome oxidase subunit 3